MNEVHHAVVYMCTVLPSYHAFTGCDFSAAFSYSTTIWPDGPTQWTGFIFVSSWQSATLPSGTFLRMEKYVCVLYGEPKCSRLNDVRLIILNKIISPGPRSSPLHFSETQGSGSSSITALWMWTSREDAVYKLCSIPVEACPTANTDHMGFNTAWMENGW